MSRNVIITIVVVIVIILGGWYMLRPKQPAVVPTPSTVVSTPVPAETTAPTAASEGAMMKTGTIIKITATGFSTKTVVVKAGGSITWINDDSAPHTVNSDPHPAHTTYPPLNLGQIQPGASKTLVFPTAGTYTYHDHLHPTFKGTVVVQ